MVQADPYDMCDNSDFFGKLKQGALTADWAKVDKAVWKIVWKEARQTRTVCDPKLKFLIISYLLPKYDMRGGQPTLGEFIDANLQKLDFYLSKGNIWLL